MKYFTRIVALVLMIVGNLALEAEGRTKSPLHFADYDAEPRLPNGRIDVERLAARLKELHLTTYYFLVLHAATDWDDLKLFLPIAARNDLAVWVYLVPPSESPPLVATLYSEPFRLDFPKWAEEIAKLSLEHTNLTAWVIDDFYANHKLLTPTYVGAMQNRAKSINPGLLFLPLMYFNEIRRSFAEDYHGVIDGAVVAYPPDRSEIERAWAILNDAPTTRRAEFGFPNGTASKPGDFVSASQRGKITARGPITIRFHEREDYTGPTAGYHFKQLLVNDKVVWEEDVAGGTNGWRGVEIKTSNFKLQTSNKLETPGSNSEETGQKDARLTFRIMDKRGVGNFGVRWQLGDLKTEGLELSASLAEPERWELKKQGAFDAGFGADVTRPGGRWHLPFIVMTAGQDIEFKLRHGDPASPERMNQWLQMCLECWRDGKADGVVTYCLDKRDGSHVFDLARESFGACSRR